MHAYASGRTCMERRSKETGLWGTIEGLRACLHGGGGPQIGEVTFGGSPHLSCKRDQNKMKDDMDRRVIPGLPPPKRFTAATWGPPPP